MDSRQALQNLEVIRTLMERTCQYQLLTAKAGLAAGSLAICGALCFVRLDGADAATFAAVWGLVFWGAAAAAIVGTVHRGRERGEPIWSRQARAVVVALAPSLFAAAALTIWFFVNRLHGWLPGIWMLCYGQGSLATATYAPPPIRRFGWIVLLAAVPTLLAGPPWAAIAMGFVFGFGHVALGVVMLRDERMAGFPRLHRDVA